jgi:hypothetical protein
MVPGKRLTKKKVPFQWRNAIRKSWGANGVQQQPAGGGIHFLTVFVLGRSKEDSNKKLLEEVDSHGDLLIGDFVDDYRNATLKVLWRQLFSLLFRTILLGQYVAY